VSQGTKVLIKWIGIFTCLIVIIHHCFNPNFHEFPDVSHITSTTAEFSPIYISIFTDLRVFMCICTVYIPNLDRTSTRREPNAQDSHIASC